MFIADKISINLCSLWCLNPVTNTEFQYDQWIEVNQVKRLYCIILFLLKMNQHPNEKDFCISIMVHKNDIDELGHVNNVVYVRWVQEVAAAHWDSLASDEIKQKYAWVVLRHEIDYLSAAFEDDSLLATTWVGESNGPRSERFVQIINQKSGKLIAKAKTIWCMLDGATMRPKRVDEEVVRLLSGQV